MECVLPSGHNAPKSDRTRSYGLVERSVAIEPDGMAFDLLFGLPNRTSLARVPDDVFLRRESE
jgi:hypothetical protein